jgi:hypothetical protein
MKRETLFLRLAVIFIGLPVLALCIFGLFQLSNNPANPNYAYMLYPIVIGIYLSAIPFYIALYNAFRLLSYIDENKAFSQISVKALKNIKYCAITISALYVVLMPFVFFIAEKDDAPGLIIFGTFPVFASMVIAVFAAVLQKLLKNAIEIKAENDLTV